MSSGEPAPCVMRAGVTRRASRFVLHASTSASAVPGPVAIEMHRVRFSPHLHTPACSNEDQCSSFRRQLDGSHRQVSPAMTLNIIGKSSALGTFCHLDSPQCIA